SRLVKYSKVRAEYLVKLNRLEHLKDNHGYGENLFMIQNGQSTCDEVVWQFCQEFGDLRCDFDSPAHRPGTGHAAQVVWRTSSRIGCHQKTRRGGWRSRQPCARTTRLAT